MLRLESIMMDRGITDSELAKTLGVQQSTVFQWKAGGFAPKSSNLARLCEVLKCTPSELLGFNSIAVPLADHQGKRLYQAVTATGSFDSQCLHLFATRIRKLTGKVTEFEIWLRHIAEVLYEIELAANESDSLSRQTSTAEPEIYERLKAVLVPQSACTCCQSDRIGNVRKIDRKKRKKRFRA